MESSDGCYLGEIGGKETVNVEGKRGKEGGGSSDALKLTVRCWLGSGSLLPIDLLCGISGDCCRRSAHHLSPVACKKNADDVCVREQKSNIILILLPSSCVDTGEAVSVTLWTK